MNIKYAINVTFILVSAFRLQAAEFHPPVQLVAGDEQDVVSVGMPGYAAPCWVDLDNDGKQDLLVGQFDGGKINVFKGLGDGKLANEEWLKTDKGEIVEIPGIW